VAKFSGAAFRVCAETENTSWLHLTKELIDSPTNLMISFKSTPVLHSAAVVKDSDMAEVVGRRSLTAEARVRSHSIPCGICGGQSGSGTMFSPSTSVFPCQYHSTNAPYSFIHLPPTLYNVFLSVLQFPLSVSFHQCSILIHSSTTDAV
jgi:hypothetical protein